jgi:hypothetical protein
MGLKCKDPLNLSIDLCIVQLNRQGTVETTGPQIHSHGHHPLPELLNVVTYKGSKEVRAHQPILQQLPDGVAQGL